MLDYLVMSHILQRFDIYNLNHIDVHINVVGVIGVYLSVHIVVHIRKLR